jgi:hypothetical protein
MRRLLGCSLAFVLVFPALVAGAETVSKETVADRFDTVSYSGNNGSRNWAGPWVEEGDDGKPETGQISVTGSNCSGKCLRMTGGILSELAISRPADLSDFLDGQLSFFVHIDTDLLLISTGTLYVEVRGKQSGWKTVAQFTFLTDAGTHQKSTDISAYLGSDFELQFRLTGLLGEDTVSIDDVKISGNVTAGTTTSTSTSTTSTTSTTTTTPTTTTTSSEGRSAEASATTTTTAPAHPDRESDHPPSTDEDLIVDARTGLPTDADQSSEALAGGGDSTESGPPGGLRVTWVGVVADHPSGLMGELGGEETEVLAAELGADFSLAVEVFEKARIWISILALMVVAAVIHGVDRRRSPELVR